MVSRLETRLLALSPRKLSMTLLARLAVIVELVWRTTVTPDGVAVATSSFWVAFPNPTMLPALTSAVMFARALPFNWSRYGFRTIVTDTIDQVEKSTAKHPPYLINDWLHRLAIFKLRYAHFRKSSHSHETEDLTAWMLGEELMALLIHMKCPRSTPLAIHKSLINAKENRKQTHLFKKSGQKQRVAWRKVEAAVISEQNKGSGSFKKNEFTPPGDVATAHLDKGGRIGINGAVPTKRRR